MRYGNPSIPDRLDALKAEGCDRILLVPLYPQYAAATTATVVRQGLRRAVAHALAADVARRAALLRRPGLYRRAGGVAAGRELAKLAFRAGGHPRLVPRHPEGLCRPRAIPIRRNASRRCGFCATRLGLDEDKLMLTFQSRFGRAEWLTPYTDKTVKALAQARRKKHRRHHAGIFRRLPRDAGRDRRSRTPRSSITTAARISPRSPASTTATTACA